MNEVNKKLTSLISVSRKYVVDSSGDKSLNVLGKRTTKLKAIKGNNACYCIPFPIEFLQGLRTIVPKGFPQIREEVCHTLDPKDISISRWAYLIKNPPDTKQCPWPIDIIDLGGEKLSLVFPFREDLGGYVKLDTVLSNTAFDSDSFDINTNISVARNLVEVFSALDEKGYLYNEFSSENMFYNMDNEVTLDFSFWISGYDEINGGAKIPLNRMWSDYVDPYYFNRKSFVMDRISNYFSFSVMLFRLLVGILPFQGRLLEGVPNITKRDHDDFITQHHSNPVFIFDEYDDLNRISPTKNPIRYIERFMSLPPEMRGMFIKIFKYDNVMRTKKDIDFFSPKSFRACLISPNE